MGIPQRVPLTPEQLKAHKKSIALCHGAACMVELERVFGTRESNALERMIDGKDARLNEDGEARWSRKYDRYLKGSVPKDITVMRAERVAIAMGRPTHLRHWRDNTLWALLAEPGPSLGQVRSLMAGLPPVVRKEIYFLAEYDPRGRLLRQPFSRNGAIRLRDQWSLDAFVGLLALAREGEILEDDPQQALSARCLFEMLPRVLLDNSPLRAEWHTLYQVLETVLWRRAYHGGAIVNDFTLQDAEFGLQAVAEDRNAKLPWTAGRLSACED